MITPQDYNQFKAFARVDGLLLGLAMSVTFFLFVASLKFSSMQIFYMIGIFVVPIIAVLRFRHYRDCVVQSRVSFRRAFAYGVSCFMYASLILAILVFLYFQFVDKGFFLSSMKVYFDTPEMKEAMKIYGEQGKALKEQIEGIGTMRPVDMAMSLMMNTVLSGAFFSFFMSLFCRREPRLNK